MQQYTNVVQDPNGAVQAGVHVSVLTVLGSAAVLYSDNGLTVQPNPMTTDAFGGFSFYTSKGQYQILVNGVFWQLVNIFDPINLPAAVSDYTSVALAMANGGLMTKDEAAQGNMWYWGRYMSGPQATGAGPRGLGYGPGAFMFDIRQDTSDCGSGFMLGLYGRIVFGGSSVKGGRIGTTGHLYHSLGATNAANANRNYVGLLGQSISVNGDGGSDTGSGAKGAYFGGNFIGRLEAGATNVFAVTAFEANTYTLTGSSAKYVLGASIVGFNNVRGTVVDAALEIGGAADSGAGITHVGWNNGILFSDIHTADPFHSGSKLISAYWSNGVPRKISMGLDTTGFTCTNGIVLGPAMVLTDNALILGVNGGGISSISAGNGATDANLDLFTKGAGGVRIYDGASGVGSVRFRVDSRGPTFVAPSATADPPSNGEMLFNAVSNTSAKLKYRGSDGTVRSITFVLA